MVAAHLNEIPAAPRDTAVTSLTNFGQTPAGAVEPLMKALPLESNRVTLATGLVTPFGKPALGIAALQNLGSEASRVEALSAAATTYQQMMANPGNPQAAKVRQYFEATFEQLQLSPVARDRVNAALMPIN